MKKSGLLHIDSIRLSAIYFGIRYEIIYFGILYETIYFGILYESQFISVFFTKKRRSFLHFVFEQ